MAMLDLAGGVVSLLICRPTTVTFRAVRECPTCKCRRRFVGLAAVWYGTLWTCCACGDAWGDGERLERPFARGWRKRSIDEARRLWADAPTRSEAARQFRLMVEYETNG